MSQPRAALIASHATFAAELRDAEQAAKAAIKERMILRLAIALLERQLTARSPV